LAWVRVGGCGLPLCCGARLHNQLISMRRGRAALPAGD
jgi:hypothetical protein